MPLPLFLGLNEPPPARFAGVVERARTGRTVVVVGVAVRRTVWRRGVRRRKRGETLLEAMMAVGRGEVGGVVRLGMDWGCWLRWS